MGNIPPEKFYEACITYHLVKEFSERFGIRLFPFSISQIEEYKEGYDFGYQFRETSFVLQYKRPSVYTDKKCYWKIDKQQLVTLKSNPLKSFYALPAFTNALEWYEGIQKCCFVESERLYQYFVKKDSKNISEDNAILINFEDFIGRYESGSKNLAYKYDNSYISFIDIYKFALQVPLELKEHTWVYLIKEV